MRRILLLLGAFICLTSCLTNKSDNSYLYGLDYIPVEYDNGYIYLDVNSGKKAEGSQVYEMASFFYNGIAVVRYKDSLRFIDRNYKPVSLDGFSEVTIFNDNIAYVVKPTGHITAIDNSGKSLFSLDEAEYAYRFNDGVSVFITKEDKYGLVNTRGEVIIEPDDYVGMGPYGYNGMINVAIETNVGVKWGVVNYKNQEIIPCEYDEIQFNSSIAKNKLFLVGNGGNYGVIDMRNNEIIPREYEGIYFQPDGNFLFAKYYRSKGETRFGWLNKKGEEIIAPLYSKAAPFIWTNLAPVTDPSKMETGYINKKGDWVIEPRYEYAENFFENGLAIVKNSVDEYGAINEDGTYVIKAKYDKMEYLGEGLYLVENNREQGIINTKGEQMIKMTDIYDYHFPDEDLSELSMVQSHYVNIDDIVDKMMEDIQKIQMDILSKLEIQKRFNIVLDDPGWKTLWTSSNNYYSSSIQAYVDYDSGYSFYAGYYKSYYLSKIRVLFDLNYGKVRQNKHYIYNELAHRLGAQSVMNEYGTINNDKSFHQDILPNCIGTLDDLTILFVPISGKIE